MSSSTGQTQGATSQSRNLQGGMSQGQTGTPDPMYDLVSLLYHSLKSATTIQQYIQDAQGDQELKQFFQQCLQQEKQTADKAKQLLGQKLSSMTAH
jgi:hypothetical protein